MKTILIPLFVLISLTIQAQQWIKLYGNFAPRAPSPSVFPGGVVETYDKGYLIAIDSVQKRYAPSIAKSVLIKTDINGNILWNKRTDSFAILSMATVQDGTIIGGYTKSSGGGYLMKLDNCGISVWAIMLNYSPGSTFIEQLKENKNNDILAVGTNYGDQPSVLFCFDKNGNFKWEFGDSMSMYSIQTNENRSILISGITYFSGNGEIYSQDILLDSTGKILWKDIYGNTPPYHYGWGGIGFCLPSGNYVSIYENYDYNPAPGVQLYMINYDSSGRQKGVVYFGDTASLEGYSDGIAVNDSTLLCVGSSCTKDYGDNCVLRILKVNLKGKVLARKDVFLGSETSAYIIRKTFNNKFIIGGSTNRNGILFHAVLKIDENLNVDTFYTHPAYKYDYLCPNKIKNDSIIFPNNYTVINTDTMHFYTGINTPVPYREIAIKIYPDPFTERFIIEYSSPHSTYSVEVFDLTGRRLYVRTKVTESKFEVNAATFPAATYVVRITAGNEVRRFNLVKIKN